ncbi:glycoside hydrolase family 16 protein [Lutimonas zeaxanthinifaciens]|uniref:glycoside hydrolase family 16 protein n=1 Tax=Lutimonas zeaxanthinifaciens TaxID=3060215 RepID=UPI00265D20AD|nr:glycoside hydrolase family 16 protein [Lutimonas sp. YSD2104]WKK65131.1 glycoside hydrolase family 16 protein [Lutimonas sp. YSD2104]
MKIRYFLLVLIGLFVLISCGGDSEEITPPAVVVKNLNVTFDIQGATSENPEGDGSGKVTFNATADNATSYILEYDGNSQNMVNGELTVTFDDPGIQDYSVKVTATGSGGSKASKNVDVKVKREYEVPDDLLELLTNNSSQKWRVQAEVTGHFGVGPEGATVPEYYKAQSFEKDFSGMYDDEFVFDQDKSFDHITGGTVYGKAGPLEDDLGSTSEPVNDEDEYENYPLNDYSGTWNYGFIDGRETLYLSDFGFLGFYVGGTHAYTILQRTETAMVLRTYGADELSWFILLSTEEEYEETVFDNLVFEDNFSTNGAPDEAKWNYDLEDGCAQSEDLCGWGNNEEQWYTDRSDNVRVEDGNLYITAKRESRGGKSYTSARLKTENKYEFTYGRVDVRAKLPSGGGTWPAIWMLGADYETNIWPGCGEIDIMEYVGNDPGKIRSSLHSPSSSGATENTKEVSIENENDEFHLYSVSWTEDQISFYLDGERFYTYYPFQKDNRNWPFNKDQFLIFNIAMGGNLGGAIDPDFDQAEMVIDYVRVYQ